MGAVKRRQARLRRQKRVRKKVLGIPERPRLCVFRSSKHIYAQLIDDTTGRTLLATSSLPKDLGNKIARNSPIAIGAAIKAVNANYDASVNGFEVEIEAFGNCFGTTDFEEGTSAFLEKRKPQF